MTDNEVEAMLKQFEGFIQSASHNIQSAALTTRGLFCIFAQQVVGARAHTYRDLRRGAWQDIQDCKAIFDMINEAGKVLEEKRRMEQHMRAAQAGMTVGASGPPTGQPIRPLAPSEYRDAWGKLMGGKLPKGHDTGGDW